VIYSTYPIVQAPGQFFSSYRGQERRIEKKKINWIEKKERFG
jgi:hypothetical protein